MRYAGLYIGLLGAVLGALVFMLSGYWGSAIAGLLCLFAGLGAAAVEEHRKGPRR